MRIPVDECPAGPEMDAAVAMLLEEGEIFKLSEEHWYLASNQAAFERVTQIGDFCFESEDDFCHPLVPYSSGITAAWELEKSLTVDQQADYVMALHNLVSTDLGAPDFATFNKALYWRMVHASPLNRCRAYLKINGVTEIEIPDGVSP